MSDLCTYSGETYNSVIDTDVVYEKNGIPYIPGRRLKGCIREAALEMKELGFIEQAQYDEIFGKEGDQNAAFSLSNAYILNYVGVVNALKKCKYPDLKSKEKVLGQYTYVRRQTAIDMETGVAAENTLRSMRVIRRGLVFIADCNWTKKVSKPEILGQAISLVKHMGVARTRGLGLVDIALSDSESGKISHTSIDKSQVTEQNKIRYTIKLREPMICKSPQGNQAATEDYISGAKVLGLIAGALPKQIYQELLSGQTEFIVSNGYIMNGNKRCLPAGISLYKEKDRSYDQEGKMIVKDMLLSESSEIEDEQMISAKIRYIDEDGTVAEVITEISYHHQRPEDKSIGRATGRKDGSSFYQLAAMSAGQSFCGYIYAGKKQVEQIIEAVEKLGEIRMGYGKFSGFGAVDFMLDLDDVHMVKTEEKMCKDAMVILVSDMILYNEKGMPTTDIKVLENKFREITGIEKLEVRKPFLQYEMIGGYNVTWQCRKPIFYALGKGSTFILHFEREFEIGLLDGAFLGERVSEGYGEIRVKEVGISSDTCVKKKRPLEEEPEEEVIDESIIERLWQTEFEWRIQKMIREILERKKEAYKKKNAKYLKELKTAVSKLRIIYRNEISYEDMKEQVQGIRNEEKNNRCIELLELICPNRVKEDVTKEMRQEYDFTFENKWSKEKLFKIVYRFYLAELKYFVKSIQGGEN